MKKLTYWIAERLDDSRAYSARAKTKKECMRIVAENPHADFAKPKKHTIHYTDAFDLMENCLSENRGGE